MQRGATPKHPSTLSSNTCDDGLRRHVSLAAVEHELASSIRDVALAATWRLGVLAMADVADVVDVVPVLERHLHHSIPLVAGDIKLVLTAELRRAALPPSR
jgi:hypothetical protein